MAPVRHGLYWLAVLVCLFSPAHSTPRHERSFRTLDLTGAIASDVGGSCCLADAAVLPCDPDLCPVGNPLGSITDGNAFTEWLVNFTSNEFPGASHEVFFTLQFSQSYRFQSVTLLSTTSPLPRQWSVSIQSPNETFQKLTSNNDGAFQQTVVLGKNEVGPSSMLQVAISLPTTAFPDPIAVAEIIVSVNDSTLPEDLGCGACVDQLIDTLDEVVPDLRNASSTLDSLVNQTQIELLSESVLGLDSGIGRYEDFLQVVGVVLGVTPDLEDNAILAEQVPRLDLSLVPPIPEKLEILTGLINDSSMFTFDLSDLEMDLSDLMRDILDLEAFHRNLLENITSLSVDFSELIATLEGHINRTMQALEEVRFAHEFVVSTSFSEDRRRLAGDLPRVEAARDSSEALLAAVNATHEQVREASLFASQVDSMLLEAQLIIERVYNQSESALQTVAAVDNLINLIQNYLSDGVRLNSSIVSSLVTIRSNLEQSMIEIDNVNASLPLIQDLLFELRSQVDVLRTQVEEYRLQLSPYQLPPGCDVLLPCVDHEFYIDSLFKNATEIVNSSRTIYTLLRARSFLASISQRGQLFDYSLVNQTAVEAREIAELARLRVNNLTIVNLIDQVISFQQQLNTLEGMTAVLRSSANTAVSRSTRLTLLLQELEQQLQEQQDLTIRLENTTATLSQNAGLAEARRLLLQAELAKNASMEAEDRIGAVEIALEGVADDITQTRNNVEESDDALNSAESKFENIALLLNRTRVRAADFTFNTTTFIAENDRLIGQINDIIAGLEDIHTRLARINSPVNLASQGADVPYISLQPPPGKIVNESIQFESLELFFGTSAAFSVPSMLFYVGPLYESNQSSLAVANADEDYILLTVEEPSTLQLQWKIGGRSGMVTTGFASGFENWVVISRHGFGFELRYGARRLDARVRAGTNSNGTILFRISERTAYLVGGWPRGTQLGVQADFNTFQGQFHLILFNGEQWGLWNIRGSSDTGFIGVFQENEPVFKNVWMPLAVSFDGRGYLFVDQLSDDSRLAFYLALEAEVLPRDNRDALVLYAYDNTTMISLEMAYINETALLRVFDHGANRVVYEIIPDEPVRKTQVGYLSRNRNFIRADRSMVPAGVDFFHDLTRVKMWIGGVRTDLLQAPFVPQFSNGSFFGCISLSRSRDASMFSLFQRQEHFLTHYLGSSVQKGFSGTCLETTYVFNAGFSGDPNAYLSFNYLLLHKPVDDDMVYGSSLSGHSVISFSLFPNEARGVLLVALGRNSAGVFIYFADGRLVAEIQYSSGSSVLLGNVSSNGNVTTKVWHQVLLELTPSIFTLYYDGFILDQKSPLPDFVLEIPTSAGATEPVIFVGGASSSILPAVADKQFAGCINDLAFNFNGLELFSEALTSNRRGVEGVSYNTCPFFNASTVPLLAVLPEDPRERSCFGNVPLRLPDTQGAFHRTTTLTTSNIVDLLGSSWTLSLMLRQLADGHVITVASTEGHVISVSINSGQAVLTLSGRGRSVAAPGLPIDRDIFTPLVIRCEVVSVIANLSCSLSAGETPVQSITLQVPYTVSPIFFPNLPITMGAMSASGTESFVGCIKGLAINGDSSRFGDVNTGLDCFNSTRVGLGFSGISYIGLQLSALSDVSSRTISFEFQPLLDNGLLFLLSESNGTSPTLAVGMFNGDLVVSDLSGGSGTVPLRLASVCSTANSLRYQFSVQYNTTHAMIVITSGATTESAVLPFSAGNSPLLLSLGNTPAQLIVQDSSDLFGFLLTDNRPQSSLPPGFTGCIRNIRIDGSSPLSNDTVMEEVLDGYCPN